MSQLPEGTLGVAVGVLIYTFTCLITNILLIWLHWVSRQRLSYVALIAYFGLICTLSSIIQQIYNYTLWNDLMWAQLHYVQANYENADVAFNNGNFGFMRVLASIRLFCYIMESSYLLSYSIQITFSVYDLWSTRRYAKKFFAFACRLVPLVLAGISIGLLQTPIVQRSFLVYMIVANVQSCVSCAISIILLMMILWKFVHTKRSFRYVDTPSQWKGRWFRSGSKASSGTDSNGIPEHRPPPKVFDNSWLVFRLSVAIVLISLFIFASLATHLPQRDDIARDAQADEPDLGPGRARSNIVGYIFGVTPGLAIWIVFGLTKEYREIMHERFVPGRWRKSGGQGETEPSPLLQSPWTGPPATPNNQQQQHMPRLTLAPIATDIELQLDDLDRYMKRRAATPDPDVMATPLLTQNQIPGPTRSFYSARTEGEGSQPRRFDG